VVGLTYELHDTDGALIEKNDTPIEYLHGGYDGIFALVERALTGKSVGDTCLVRLEPEDAFGDYDAGLVQMEPLDKFRPYLTIVSGLRNKPAESPEPHAYIERTWLSCVSPFALGVANPDAGVTADQFAVRHIGQETRLPSLELCTALRGAQVAWRTPKLSLPQSVASPRRVAKEPCRMSWRSHGR